MKKYRLKGLPKGITCTLISELHGEGEKIPFYIKDNMKSFSLRPEDNPLWFEEIVKERSAKDIITKYWKENSHRFYNEEFFANYLIQALKDAGYAIVKVKEVITLDEKREILGDLARIKGNCCSDNEKLAKIVEYIFKHFTRKAK